MVFLDKIFRQKFSVVPGAMVLSIITMSFFLYFLDTKEHAEDKAFKSGLFELSTGVGTVTINMLLSIGRLILLEKNFIFFLKKNFFFISLFRSIFFFN